MSGLPEPPFTGTAGEMIDRLCDEFEAGWLSSQPVPLEAVVRAAPESMRPALFRELLAIERVYRSRDGRPITLAEAQRRFAALGSGVGPIVAELLCPTGDWSPVSEPPGGFTAALTSQDEPVPASVGGYRVVRRLGGGGMGVVYLADDLIGRRQVAVKVIRPQYAADSTACERFLREAQAAMAVEDDHVVPVYQVGQAPVPFLVMPLLKGESLEDRLGREPLAPLALILKVGREVALGLAAAHEKGLVHRDAKPSNTWLEGDPTASAPEQQVRRVKVLDFGLARSASGDDGVSVAGLVVGTPAYMAPEQARGERVNELADLFSLGAILYRMATGQPAFSGPTITAVLTAIATHHPPPPIDVNPAIPPALSQLIEQLLEKEPGKRPTSTREVADVLAALEKGQTSSVPRPRRSSRWLAVAGVLLATAVTAVALWLQFGGHQPNEAAQGETKEPTLTVPNSWTPDVKPPLRAAPLRVKSLDVKHFVETPMGDVARGILGRESFAPRLGDKVQVVAKLSRPGYAYVIAFRPDGAAELCFPTDEDTVPPLTDTPRYPEINSTEVFGLREGTGLWVFAIVASEKQLPTYRQWLANRKPNWKRVAAPTGSIWWYDGIEMATLLEGREPALRAKGEQLTGPAATVHSLGRWLQESTGNAIGVLGFGVGEEK